MLSRTLFALLLIFSLQGCNFEGFTIHVDPDLEGKTIDVSIEAEPTEAPAEPEGPIYKDSYLPVGVFTEQVHPNAIWYIADREVILIKKTDMNYHIPIPDGEHATWTGFLWRNDSSEDWRAFYNTTETGMNPVGIFEEEGSVFIDFQDTNGAGSGEGELLRYEYDAEGNWSREGSYYMIPELYFGLGLTEIYPQAIE
jgi:hypothetical protein